MRNQRENLRRVWEILLSQEAAKCGVRGHRALSGESRHADSQHGMEASASTGPAGGLQVVSGLDVKTTRHAWSIGISEGRGWSSHAPSGRHRGLVSLMLGLSKVRPVRAILPGRHLLYRLWRPYRALIAAMGHVVSCPPFFLRKPWY